MPVEQTRRDHVESFHTRNGFSRQRMTARAADELDRALGALVDRHCPDGVVRGVVAIEIVWGQPHPGGEPIRPAR